jgi:hypothetical protein
LNNILKWQKCKILKHQLLVKNFRRRCHSSEIFYANIKSTYTSDCGNYLYFLPMKKNEIHVWFKYPRVDQILVLVHQQFYKQSQVPQHHAKMRGRNIHEYAIQIREQSMVGYQQSFYHHPSSSIII